MRRAGSLHCLLVDQIESERITLRLDRGVAQGRLWGFMERATLGVFLLTLRLRSFT